MKKSIFLLSAAAMLFSFTSIKEDKGIKISNYVEKEDGTFSFNITDLDKPLDDRFRTYNVVIDQSVKILLEEDVFTARVTKYVYCE